MRSLVFLVVLFALGCATNGSPAPSGEAVAAASMPAYGEKHMSQHDQHHGHHRFDDAKKWAERFEDPARDAWQRPDHVLSLLELRPEDKVADIGSATGYFSVRLAAKVPEGAVFGVDVEPDMVDYLNERAASLGLDNLKSVLGTASDPQIPEPVDVVLVVNTYHHIEAREAYFERVRGQLKPGARLCIVDFKPGDLPIGPPTAMKIPPEQVVSELEAAGYRLAQRDDSLPYQFLLVLVAR